MAEKNFSIKDTSRSIFGRRVSRRYRHAAMDFSYEVIFQQEQWGVGQRLVDLNDEMESIWTDLIEHVLQAGAQVDDLMRIHIGHDVLTHGDIIISLRKISDMTPEAIWAAMSKILQSYQNLLFDESLKITVGVIRLPRGSGRSKMINREQSISNKTSVVKILNQDNMCMARSLVVCRAYRAFKTSQMTGYEYEKIRKNISNQQTRQALELYELANHVASRNCSYSNKP
jgi:hypothetical protein